MTLLCWIVVSIIGITIAVGVPSKGQLLDYRVLNYGFRSGKREEQFIVVEGELTWMLSWKVEFYFLFL